jgi:tetratricopeptide (TPR) repeat protein
MRSLTIIANLFFLAFSGGWATPNPARAQATKPMVVILPLPTRDVPPPDQDLVLANLAAQLRSQYGVSVLAGRAVGRAVWGTLGSGLEEAAEAFASKVAAGKQAYQKLQIGRARKLLEQAQKPLAKAGAEVRDPQLFVDLHVYHGLSLLAEGKSKQAAKDFRQAVAMNPDTSLSPRQFPPDVIKAFERAKRQLLSGRPTQVRLMSKPAGADVFIDGKRQGVTPLTAPVYPGYHFVRVQKEGFSPWTLNLPDGVAPKTIRARLVQVWSGEPPEDLVATAIAREDLDESVRARLRLMAGTYSADAFLLASMNREGDQTHLGLRLFVVDPEIVTRARLFNLGATPAEYPTKLKGIASTLKSLRQARARSRTVAVAPVPARVPSARPEPKPDPEPSTPAWARPPSTPVAAAVPRDERPVAVPVDEQTDDDRAGAVWYKSWWFWTITGVVVAGAAAGTSAYFLTREQSDWTLVIQPGQ